MKYIFIFIIISILIICIFYKSLNFKEYFAAINMSNNESIKKFYMNKQPVWLCYSKCKDADYEPENLMKYDKKYVTRIKQLYGTIKKNYIKGKYKGNLLIENLLKKYSAKCKHFCKPIKYSKKNWTNLKKINPGIWKIKGEKPNYKPLYSKPSNLILCKSKCKPTKHNLDFQDFKNKYKDEGYTPVLFRPNKDLSWGKYHPLPKLSNNDNGQIFKCKESCMPFNYTKELIKYVKKKNKNKVIWDQEIYSPKKINNRGILRTKL